MTQMALRDADHSNQQVEQGQSDVGGCGLRTPASRVTIALPPSFASRVRSILKARRAREALIGRNLFADPAWDILLELYATEIEQRRVATSDLSVASAVPLTTVLRWIDRLENTGLITRRQDALDRRRVWIALSPVGCDKMKSYFVATGMIGQELPAA
jgi:DNA-binding MarR family transcriptional regulator